MSDAHPGILEVHKAAAAVIDEQHPPETGAFWRRWFDSPHEAHLLDHVRAFIGALGRLMDVPPTMLSQADLSSVGRDVELVVKRMDTAIEDPALAGSGVSGPLASAVYAIRARYEELYRRGATKA